MPTNLDAFDTPDVEPLDHLASMARTALTDPTALCGADLRPFDLNRIDTNAAASRAVVLAVEYLDSLIDTYNPATQTRVNFARSLRAMGRGIAERMDDMRAIGEGMQHPDDTAGYTEAAGALDDALDRIDSAIRTLEDPDVHPDNNTGDERQHSVRVTELTPYTVELEGAEPTMMIQPALDRGVTVTVKPSGTVGHDITLSGPRAAVLDLIAEQWGPDDARTYGWAPPLTLRQAMVEAADACTTLADLDEGENTDPERLQAVAEKLRSEVDYTDSADGSSERE